MMTLPSEHTDRASSRNRRKDEPGFRRQFSRGAASLVAKSAEMANRRTSRMVIMKKLSGAVVLGDIGKLLGVGRQHAILVERDLRGF